MAEINKKVGLTIRQLREKKGWLQKHLASRTGFQRSYIGQIERGEKNIGLINLEKISRALGVKMKDLVR